MNKSFNWKWFKKDIPAKRENTVFSCFSCGGGSSYGYKLAGLNVVGCVEIDPKMMALYKRNHNPKHAYQMDIRDFLKIDSSNLPTELFSLDILDGSPPCSVFSRAGKWERGWGVEQVFREGQATQRLDDLFFHFISVAEKLQPKIVVAENVAGLIQGKAKGFVNEIFAQFDKIEYDAQLFLLNSATMGVPQSRERCFFIARKKEFDWPRLTLNFNEPPVNFGAVRASSGCEVGGKDKLLLQKWRPGDKYVHWIEARERASKKANFRPIVADDRVAPTITASGQFYRQCDLMRFSDTDFINCQTFPQDYDFVDQPVQYVCGMSVPPVMMAYLARELMRQWLKRDD